MNKKLLALLTLAAISQVSLAQKTFYVKITNPTKEIRKEQPVVLQLDKETDVQSAVVTLDGKEIPSQLDDLDRDGTFDELCFLTDLDKRQILEYKICLYDTGEPRVYPSRVFAEILLRNPKIKQKNAHDFYLNEISVPKNLKDPYHLLHHHGVALENELIAMRIYFDKRQTVDLYGKYKKGLEVEKTQFYTSKEQKEEGFGDDVLWVGNTFGLGAFRGWNGQTPTMIDDVNFRTQRIVANGPIRTIVEVENRGWKAISDLPRLNMTTRYTLYAGRRDAEVNIFFNRNVNGIDFSTGIINVKNSTEYSDKKGLRGCWGSDWPTGEKDSAGHKRETVGLGIYIPNDYRKSEEPANKDNYAFVIDTQSNVIKYRITYTSDNEEFGYHSAKDWFAFLKEWRKEIDMPNIIERID